MADRVGQQLGNYQLISLLGRGGFAEVYLGEHIYLKTKAAIKILHTQLEKDDMESFLTEARTIANLVHPHIVRVLEFAVESSSNTPFLVLDYAPNGSLRQRHPKGTQVPVTNVTSYVSQIASALQHAHDQRLIHRDVKPENMLLGRDNDVLLGDFGIALVAQSSRYQHTQDIVGTAAYMSPEQIRGKPRPASDQYSLGVVVYEWLSGERPFHGSFTELCTQHIFASPPSLRERVPAISPEVEQVVMTALAKEPKERFGNLQAFARALEQASRSEQFTDQVLSQNSSSLPASPLEQSAEAPLLAPGQSAESLPPTLPPESEPAAASPSFPTTLAAEPQRLPAVDSPGQAMQPHIGGSHFDGVEPATGGVAGKPTDLESRKWQTYVRRLVGVDVRRALIALVFGIILYSSLNYYLDLLYKNNNPLAVMSVPVLNDSIDGGIILAGLFLIIPLFLAVTSGPLVSLLTMIAGLTLGSLLVGYDAASYYGVSWTWFVGRMLISFIAGLAIFLTRGHYNTARATALAVAFSAIAIVIGTAFTTYGDIAVSGSTVSDAWTAFTRLTLPATVDLIALPVLLMAYSVIGRRKGYIQSDKSERTNRQ